MSKIIPNRDIDDDEIRIVSKFNFCSNSKKSEESDIADKDDVDADESSDTDDAVDTENSPQNYSYSPDSTPDFDDECKSNRANSTKKMWINLFFVVAVVIGGFMVLFMAHDEDKIDVTVSNNTLQSTGGDMHEDSALSFTDEETTPFVSTCDTVIGENKFLIIEPHNATPVLKVGQETLRDSSAVLIVQAADVRGDNGEIAGAFVERGKLLSKGRAKAGFCAIIDGNPIIGVAQSTPLLEQALDTDGYFFRQYPLVVGGHAVVNKPKGQSMRKALAEIDGRLVVVLSLDKMTFESFSRALVELGVENAIYLVGSGGQCLYRNGDKTVLFGKDKTSPYKNVNYIVWK